METIKRIFSKPQILEDENCPLYVNCPDYMGACYGVYNLCDIYLDKKRIAENFGKDLVDEIIGESIRRF